MNPPLAFILYASGLRRNTLSCAPRICLSFPSLICLFKELCARRLLSAGENEYITAYILCQHFLKFFFIFFVFFPLALLAPQSPPLRGCQCRRPGRTGPEPGRHAAPLWSRGLRPVPARGHRGLPSGATAAAGGFAP